jgi:thymidylate synthase (FAD)
MSKSEVIGKRVEVLDQGWIELQDVMGDDLAIVNAARVSFLGESKGDDADKKLLFYLMRHRHTSPFEQVEFKFRVRAPLLVWWQWVRHRTWHVNAQSGRYTPFQEDDFYHPTAWRRQSESNKQGSQGEIDPADAERLSVWLAEHYRHSYELYQQALEAGVAKEQARIFLPGFASYYTWVCKVDAHNLMHFLSLRMAPDAQAEIRAYAQAIYQHFFKPSLPWTAEAFGRYVLGETDEI